ncbi:hypothetical protein ACIBF1_19800 [Spirillospora sp. NPDC050679]
MALVVTFTGKVPLPAPNAGTAYKIWSYRVEASGGGELNPGHRIALGLPQDVDVQNPDAYAGVPQLANSFLQRDTSSSRQYVGRTITSQNSQTISFVAPAAESTCEMFLVKGPHNQPWTSVPFATGSSGTPNHVQVLPSPVSGPPVLNGRPVGDFAGTLPYASEVFGVYQPLAGWFGAQSTLQACAGKHEIEGLDRAAFFGEAARALDDRALARLAERFDLAAQGVLSPVGLVNLFRQYFFEFDTFLGAPAGHLWISPGGTVEVVETSTRRTLVERTAEQSEETSRKSEESLTQQEDVADAVKEENANDTKLGVSVTGGVNAGIYHADASASFSTQSTVKRSSEETHKHSRTQSAKVTSEIKRNFKTTFRTVTETTDTSSRRYLVQNTTNELVNYELRRKMRKVGVQLQHIGTRLSWQVYFDAPGRDLGLGDLVHVVSAPDLSTINKPATVPYPADQQVSHPLTVPFILYQGADHDAENTYKADPDADINHGYFDPDVGAKDIVQFRFDYKLPPPPAGFELHKLSGVDFHGAQVQFTTDAPDLGTNPDPVKNSFALRLTHCNWQRKKSLPLDATFVYTPTKETLLKIDKANAEAQAAYTKQVAQLQHEAYANAVRERLKLVSSMRPRRTEDLRSEERQTVFGQLIRRLSLGDDPHLGSELIRQIFDVDEMLYFVAPDFWRPGAVAHPTQDSVGKYPVPAPSWGAEQTTPLAGDAVASWYSHTDKTFTTGPAGQPVPEWRVNYLITEDTRPAPLGSSLGWLIQTDGDERRNEFLNAAWVKAVLPVRPGHEVAALAWLAEVEGEAALGLPYPFQPGDPPEYQGKKVGEVLQIVAGELQAANTDVANTLATEEAFETGFDPLAGGFRPAEPYQVFDQWVEVLPTDQVAAVQIKYDPKTGQQG